MKRLVLTGIAVLVGLLVYPCTSAFAFELFDGRLHDGKGSIQQTMNYRTHRDVRDVAISSFRTTFRIEGLYDVVKNDKWDIKLYGLFNYWYDGGVDVEANLRRAVKYEDGSSSGAKELRRPNCEEEIIREFYLEIWRGDFQARLGKQLVSWGETAESRVADVINPLDLNNIIAFPDWEDFKVGLWMGRFYYTPQNMWQDISFELVFIPPDFQPNRMPSAGSGLYFGTPQMPNGLFGKMLHKMEHDRPANDWSNTEVGLRIKGYSFDTDWTLSHFYTRADSPIIDGRRGFNQFMNLALGLPVGNDIFTYPNYNSTAFTFQRTWDWLKSTIRGEVVLNSNKYYQYGTYKKKKCDLLTWAISWDRNNMVPWLSYWNRSRSVATSLTWLHYRLLGHKYNKSTGEFIAWEAEGQRDSTWNKLTLSVETGFLYDTIYPVFNFAYDFNGDTTVVGALRYAPGDHWRWMVIYQQVNEMGHPGKLNDQVILSMRYEF